MPFMNNSLSSILSVRASCTDFFRFAFNISSSQIHILRPLPSMKGWHTFISTYLSAISSKVVSGIFDALSIHDIGKSMLASGVWDI